MSSTMNLLLKLYVISWIVNTLTIACETSCLQSTVSATELSCFSANRVTLSPTKVDADHSNDVHLSNDVFYPNRSTISSTEVSFSYSTSKTVTHLSIHFWADLSVNLKSFTIALFHLIRAFASRFFSRFDARTRFFASSSSQQWFYPLPVKRLLLLSSEQQIHRVCLF